MTSEPRSNGVPGRGARDVWLAVLAGTVLLIGSVALFAVARPITVLPQDIAGERQATAGDVALLVAALALAAAVPFVLARLTGHHRWALTGAFAGVVALAVMVVLGNLLEGLLGAATTLLALGLGVVGTIALRAPGPTVLVWRGVTVTAIVALSVLLVRAGLADPTPVIVLPGLALADTLVAASRAG